MRPWEYNIEGEGEDPLRRALNFAASADWHGLPKFIVSNYYVIYIKRDKWGYYSRAEEGGHETLFMGSELTNSEKPGTGVKLAFPHDIDATFDFIRRWLKHANRGQKHDTDGDNQPGWRLFTPPGIEGSCCYPSLAIQAIWIIYGK